MSLVLVWLFRIPKVAASLPLISVTFPRSCKPLGVDLTWTSLIRAKFVAVGVDLITRRRIFCSLLDSGAACTLLSRLMQQKQIAAKITTKFAFIFPTAKPTLKIQSKISK